MTAIIVASVVLVLMFTVATVFSINIGVLAFPAAFAVGVLGGLTADDILASFPDELFVLLAGVTFLFAIAQNNGTIEWLTQAGLRLVKGNVAVMPWVFHGAGIVITAAGALPGATCAILAPLAMRFAAAYSIGPFLVGILLIHGIHAGSMSPISPFGVIVNGAVARADLPNISLPLFLNVLLFNIAIAVVAFLFLGGPALVRRVRSRARAQPVSESASGEETTSKESPSGSSEQSTPLNFYQAVTLFGILALIVLALGFKFDVGFTAFTIAMVLVLMSPEEENAIRQMPWAVILLVTGMLTFIGVIEEIGVLDVVSDAISNVAGPLLTPLVVSFASGVISLFAANAGVLAATVPIALPALQEAGVENITGAVSSLTVTAGVVDTSPVSTFGALLLANVQNMDRDVFFRRLLLWGIAMLFVGTVISWLVFVVIGLP
jgi:Na+/H+ antiporter NhaD/arsenite permease-like protein